MATTSEQKFPTFECLISDTQEEMDSEVELFFLNKSLLAAQLSKLKQKDPEWSENYEKIIEYLGQLSDAVVYMKDPPPHKFLVDLCMGEELEGDTITLLQSTGNPLVYELVEAAIKAREVIFWYVRNSKLSKFSNGFNPQRYQGLPFLRLSLIYRAVNLAGKN